MKHYCTVCRKIHEGRCKSARNFTGVRNSEADKFRNSRVWKRICSDGLSVHHIIPLAADFDKRLDDDNLITLCRYHHEQAERGTIPVARLRRLAADEFNPGYPPRGSRVVLGD